MQARNKNVKEKHPYCGQAINHRDQPFFIVLMKIGKSDIVIAEWMDVLGSWVVASHMSFSAKETWFFSPNIRYVTHP